MQPGGWRLGESAAEQLHWGMDRVRFGRVLGIGTRLAAKTLVEAVDAAAAPNPAPARPATEVPSKVAVAGERLGEKTRRATVQAKQASAGVKRGGKRFGESVWGPFTKAGGVLWLEFTGVFFGVFAVYGVSGAWRQRAYWRDSVAHHGDHMHFLLGCAMLVIFGYFTVSSFVRAGRRSRRG